jgi:predicted CxxxxCH...CXXCH cytochrome family protein
MKWHPQETACLTLALAALGACDKAQPIADRRPTDCATCHGFPPATGAHVVHVEGGAFGKKFGCLHCHKDVHEVGEPDHILRADGRPVPPPAEVRFDDPGSLAAKTEPGVSRPAQPTYDRATATCSNIYCHGGTLKGPTPGVITSIGWNTRGTAGCGTCHGIPPAGHLASITSSLQCAQCHAGGIDAQGNVSPTRHIDGTLDLSVGN